MNETTATLKEDLAQVDDRLETLKANIQLGEDLEGLHEDKRFQNVILDGYLDAESKRIFGVLTDPGHNLKRDVIENLMDKLSSTRSLKQYFGVILQNAAMGPEEVTAEELYRKELTAGDCVVNNG